MKHEKISWAAGISFALGALIAMGSEGTFQMEGRFDIPTFTVGAALILLSYVLVKIEFYLEDHER